MHFRAANICTVKLNFQLVNNVQQLTAVGMQSVAHQGLNCSNIVIRGSNFIRSRSVYVCVLLSCIEEDFAVD
jgi:hypothetical protein